MNPIERWLLWASTILVGVTGLVYAWMKYLVVSEEPFAVVHHPWQPFVLKAHILTAPLLIFAVGVVFLRHVLRQWRSREPEGRRSGLLVFFFFTAMVLSGYLIQTATGEGWLQALVVAHLATGIAYLAVVSVHQVVAVLLARRKARAEKAQPPGLGLTSSEAFWHLEDS